MQHHRTLINISGNRIFISWMSSSSSREMLDFTTKWRKRFPRAMSCMLKRRRGRGRWNICEESKEIISKNITFFPHTRSLWGICVFRRNFVYLRNEGRVFSVFFSRKIQNSSSWIGLRALQPRRQLIVFRFMIYRKDGRKRISSLSFSK